jgi:hypothetical protein
MASKRNNTRVLGSNPTRENKPKCASPLQQCNVRDDQLIHGGWPMFRPPYVCDFMAQDDHVFGVHLL